MDSQRLRRAFRWPNEDDDMTPEEMDEEQQEQLIADLEQQDQARTQFYRIAFLANPLLAALFFLVDMLTTALPIQRVKAFISLSSLLATAYIIHFMPLDIIDTKGKKPVYLTEAAKSPIQRYLPILNGVLSGVLLIAAVSSFRQGDNPDALREAAPAAIYAMSMFVREQLRPLNLNELHKARYELKGA